jgi:hypothetical protein
MVRYEQLESAKLTPEERRICDDCKAGPRSSVAPPVEHDRERHSLLASVTKANLTECDRVDNLFSDGGHRERTAV